MQEERRTPMSYACPPAGGCRPIRWHTVILRLVSASTLVIMCVTLIWWHPLIRTSRYALSIEVEGRFLAIRFLSDPSGRYVPTVDARSFISSDVILLHDVRVMGFHYFDCQPKAAMFRGTQIFRVAIHLAWIGLIALLLIGWGLAGIVSRTVRHVDRVKGAR